MLYESIRIEPLEFRNQATGEYKVVVYGGVIDLPESVGKIYPNYLRPVQTVLPEEIQIEDIQSEVLNDFGGTLTSEKTERKPLEDDIGKLMEMEEKKTEKVKKAGRPRKYAEDVSDTDKRYYQRQAKKKREEEFKKLGMKSKE